MRAVSGFIVQTLSTAGSMNLDEEIAAIMPEAVEWRHHLHSIPELGLEEKETARFVAARLRAMGLDVAEGIGVTGVVGTLRGRRGEGISLGLRAELDALPIDEETNLSYRSQRPGHMHACGHDGHMAMLLAAAKILADGGADFAGTVNFIFQPAEEGLGGALAMLSDGLFERFPCDEIYAAHNGPFPLGTVVVHHGVVCAAADIFRIEIKGRGGHTSVPHASVNPLHSAARLLLGLESLPSRVTDARHASVLTVGALNGGEAFNVIPDRVRMAGSIRSLNMQARERLEAALRAQVAGIEAAEGVTCTLDYQRAFVVGENDPVVAEHLICAALATVGQEHLTIDPPPDMGAEDFGFMMEQRPGCLFMLGQDEPGNSPLLHDPGYDFNDRLLPIGAKLWVKLVNQRLGGGESLE